MFGKPAAPDVRLEAMMVVLVERPQWYTAGKFLIIFEQNSPIHAREACATQLRDVSRERKVFFLLCVVLWLSG